MSTSAEFGVESVYDVLVHLYGLEGTSRGREFDLLCPSPNHADTRPSCGVSLETGLWSCLSCGVSGDLAALGTLVLGKPRDEVEELLKPRSPDALLSMVQRRLNAVRLPSVRKRKADHVRLPGPFESGPLTELVDRGFSVGTLLRWGVRYVPELVLQGNRGEFTITSSYAIPIRDQQSRLLNWCFRSTRRSNRWQPRYLYYAPGVSELWFGLQHHHNIRDICITEGALDAMWLDQAGFPALALLGTQMGDAKIKSLTRYKSVTLFLDRDSAGATAVQRIGSALGQHMPLYIAQYDRRINPGKKCDPQDLQIVDVEIAVERRISWSSFLIRQAG